MEPVLERNATAQDRRAFQRWTVLPDSPHVKSISSGVDERIRRHVPTVYLSSAEASILAILSYL